MSQVSQISLCFGDWHARVSAEIGGSILSVTHAGRAILRPTPEAAVAQRAVRGTACFPLIPYANRIANGRFSWDGNAYRLAENFPASPHPLHGIGWRRGWRIASAGESACVLRLEYRPLDGDRIDWPFALDAEQEISLSESGLRVQLSVINEHAAPAPLGLGLHPLFPRRGGEKLIFEAQGAWENGADMLPSSRVSGGLWDHAAGRLIGAQNLDNDFFGWKRAARIESEHFPAIRIGASPIFSCLRVFTPADKAFFAVEPVSHCADDINRGAAAQSLRTPPGARLSGTMTISVQSP